MTTITFESVHKSFSYHDGPPAAYSAVLKVEEDPDYGYTTVQFFIERVISHHNYGRVRAWEVKARQVYAEANSDYRITQWYESPAEYVCYEDAVAFCEYAYHRAKVRGSLGASGMEWNDRLDEHGNQM